MSAFYDDDEEQFKETDADFLEEEDDDEAEFGDGEFPDIDYDIEEDIEED